MSVALGVGGGGDQSYPPDAAQLVTRIAGGGGLGTAGGAKYGWETAESGKQKAESGGLRSTPPACPLPE